MFRIGEFSRIARVSARLLRFYDETGLFTPVHTEPQSGYRYYSVDQLGQLNRILVLKELGFDLTQVRTMIDAKLSVEELRHLLLKRREDAEKILTIESQRLRQIEARIFQLETEGNLSSEDVVLRSEPSQHFLSIRRNVASFDEARSLIPQLRLLVAPILPIGLTRRLVAIAHSSQFEQDEMDVEFGYAFHQQLQCVVPSDSPVQFRELEFVERMAVCVRVGLPEQSHLITAKIGRFLELQGDTLAGPSREVFLQPPDPQRMHESIVEMQFPIQRLSEIRDD